MRTMIGKRIGPVPIALVAVLALAAFISAGLWLAPTGQSAQAQGIPGDGMAMDAADDCEITVVDAAGTAQTGYFAGNDCIVSGDSATVKLLNANEVDNANDAYVAAYVTGGDDYSSIQATDADGMALGKKGIDESVAAIEPAESGLLGKVEPGSHPITVTRGMAKDGDAYVFVYVTTGTSFIADGDNTNAGVPLNTVVGEAGSVEDADVQAESLEKSVALLTAALTLIGTEDGDVVESAEAGDLPTAPTAPTFGADIIINLIDDAVTVELARTAVNTRTDLVDTDADTTAEGNDGGYIKLADDYIDAVEEAFDDYTDTPDVDDATDDDIIDEDATDEEKQALMDAIAAAKVAMGRVQAVLDAIDDDNPSVFPNADADIAIKVTFLNAPDAEMTTIGAMEEDIDLKNIEEDEEEVTVVIAVNDDNGNSISDVAMTLTIEDAPESVVFENTLEQRRRVKGNGTTMATIQGLPEEDPFNYNLKVEIDDGPTKNQPIRRLGAVASVALESYAPCGPMPECMANDSLSLSPSIEDDTTTNADETMDSLFFVISTAMDSAGNDVTKETTHTFEADDGLTRVTDERASELWWNTLDCEAMAEYDPMERKANSSNPYCASYDGLGDHEEGIVNAIILPAYFAAYMVDDGVGRGSYDVTVTTGNDMEATSTVTVAGPIHSLSLTGARSIPSSTGLGEYTVTAVDEDGNVPANVTGKKITVAVRTSAAQVLGADSNSQISLGVDGTAMFRVLVEDTVAEGTRVTIIASYGTISANPLVVNYGTAPVVVTPESEPVDTTLGNPTGLQASAGAAGSADVMWYAGANADVQYVFALPSNYTNIATDGTYSSALAGDASSHNFAGLTSGQGYWFIVTSCQTNADDSIASCNWHNGWSSLVTVQ